MSQRWILDRLIRLGGIDALWPDALPTFIEMGFKYSDVQNTMARVTALSALPVEWARTGERHREAALAAEASGHPVSALDRWHRATLCLGLAQWGIFEMNDRKRELHAACVAAFERVMALSDGRIERLDVPLDGTSSVPAVMHRPPGEGPFPVVVFLPGLDMLKEFFPPPHGNPFGRRGAAVVSIDAPGLGESLIRGTKLTRTSHEEAATAVIAALRKRPDVDPDRIGVVGIALGAQTAVRLAASDRRLAGCVSFEGGIFYDVIKFAATAQPTFKFNLMFMSGATNDDQFREIFGSMTVADIQDDVHVPYLLLQGELDELSPLHEARQLFEAIPGPKEMVLYARENHVLGGAIPEALGTVADWLADRFAGRPLQEARVTVHESR